MNDKLKTNTGVDDDQKAAITVFSKPNCQQCWATKKKLDLLGAAYTSVDVTEDEEAMSFVKELGYQQLPVVYADIDGVIRHFGGYQPEALAVLA
ncbi:glutaredoxin family protein [Brevibacterium moorei]|uniref:glutaredoxin family protein n=1 Tax=Brevibacterium moorei TaxID=2968457 RepID=UPI00211D0EED|nr:glutaredoxin family protein [Brevibacterium sp. 68QC2CO]MCQ9385091.1 glutaredoxin family protein [Brevibacterium sp. 68QC2CO]